MKTAPRSAALDVLRLAAVALVLGRHWPVEVPADLAWPLRKAAELWQRAGWAGVDLFFVLSGFLVSGLLLAERRETGQVRLGRFLARRGLKIYPAFYVFLALALPLAPHAVEPRLVAGEIFFLQNYVGGLWNHTWSLAVEEHFYLGCGLLVVALSRADRLDLLRPAFVLVAAGCLAFRVAGAASGLPVPRLLFPSHARVDALFFGVFLAYLRHARPDRLEAFTRRYRTLLAIAASGLLILPILFPITTSRFMQSAGLTATWLSSGAALLLAVHAPAEAFAGRAWRAAAAAGAMSYSIYLWHMPVGRLLARAPFPGSPGTAFLLLATSYVILSVAVGAGMSKLVELPVLRWRDRRFPAREAASVPVMTQEERA
ncbi:MAG TPA: acyltransferase [Planctomycetota bacterium]